jgi:hypothetical protein
VGLWVETQSSEAFSTPLHQSTLPKRVTQGTMFTQTIMFPLRKAPVDLTSADSYLDIGPPIILGGLTP